MEEEENVLTVFIENVIVGKIERALSGNIIFQYDENWLGEGFELAISLPLKQEPFDIETSTNYFENLLPETSVRQKVSKQAQISERDIFGLLKLLGRDCAGAISVFDRPNRPHEQEHYQEISISDLDKVISNLETEPLGSKENELKLSLAGAQEKLALYYADNHFKIPKNGAPSTHILKPEIQNFKGTVENEFFCMRLASEIGLNVPSCDVLTMFSKQVYIVKRFDRYIDQVGKIRRIPQEDLCQALGIESNKKYEENGGPKFVDCYKLLEEHSTKKIADGIMIIDWLLFNYLIGNSDAHAKNIALLNFGDGVQLAPFYDLLSTSAYPAVSKKMAMGIGKKRDPVNLFPIHFKRLSTDIEVKLELISGRATKIISKIDSALPMVTTTIQEYEHGDWIAAKITEVVSTRSRSLKGLLSI